MTKLLNGIRVLEAAVLIVGDYVGMLLADEGADVIKVEPTGPGDYLRWIGPQFAPDESALHLFANRNKRSISIDLRRDEARGVLNRLIHEADVVVTGFQTRVNKQLGLDYEAVSEIRPDIVYCQATGFGGDGPYATIPAHGSMMNALGSAPHLEYNSDGLVKAVPMPPFTESSSGVVLGPLFAAYAIAAALLKRARTGEGACIDIAASDSVVAAGWVRNIVELNWRKAFTTESQKDAEAFSYADSARYQYYRTKDGKFVLFCCIEQKFWLNFCQAVEREDLVGGSNRDRVVELAADDLTLRRELQAIFETKTQEEWVRIFVQHDIAAGPAVPIEDAPTDPQLVHRNVFVVQDHPRAGQITTMASPIHVAGESLSIPTHAPLVGQDTSAVLHELGYSGAEISLLEEVGVVQCGPAR